MKPETKGIISLFGSAFFWSIGGVIIKLIDWNSFAIAGSRSIIASIMILIYLKRPSINFSYPQLSAAFCSVCSMILYVLANKMTTAANTILLQYTAPVYVAILAWIILKEKPTIDNWIALLVIALGMALFFIGKFSAGNTVGNVFAILSGFWLALFTVFMRMQKEKSPYESFLLAHITTFVISIPFIIKLGLPDGSGLIGILLLGIFQTGVASLLFAYGIRKVAALKSMLILTLEPILNPIWVFIFTGEAPGFNAFIGGAIIILAVVFTTVYSIKKNKHHNSRNLMPIS